MQKRAEIGQRLSRVIFKRAVRKVRQREKLHHKRGGTHNWLSTKVQAHREQVTITAPTIISLRNTVHRKIALHACARIRKTMLRDGLDLVLDFTNTHHIEAAAMLIIVAELDRACRMTGGARNIRVKLPDGRSSDKEQIVREVLYQIGLLQRCNYDVTFFKPQEFHQSVKNWRYATGTRVDEKPSDILGEHEGSIAPALMQSMQIGLAEALVNSLNHAYQQPRIDGCRLFSEKRWWMFTREEDGLLSVLVCDLGIGIPRSLPLKWGGSIISKLLSVAGLDDTDLSSIRLALTLGQTSTGETHRGKGLPQIWNATRASRAGRISISSGRALLERDHGVGREVANRYDDGLLGTLISWTVAIDEPERIDG